MIKLPLFKVYRMINALKEQGFPHGAGNKTFYNRLHDGHGKLAIHLNEIKGNYVDGSRTQ